MDYQKLYYRLIEKYRGLVLEGYVERHHVVPKCLGGTNDKTNIVALTAKAHFVAHHLLHKIHPQNRKLANAFGKMICSSPDHQRTLSPRMYEAARKALSVAKRGLPCPRFALMNINRRGIKLNEEHRASIAAGCKGKNLGRKRPDLAARNRRTPGRKDAFAEYNSLKAREGFTPEEIEAKRRAGRNRKGKVMSEEGRANVKRAAIEREQRKKNCSKIKALT